MEAINRGTVSAYMNCIIRILKILTFMSKRDECHWNKHTITYIPVDRLWLPPRLEGKNRTRETVTSVVILNPKFQLENTEETGIKLTLSALDCPYRLSDTVVTASPANARYRGFDLRPNRASGTRHWHSSDDPVRGMALRA